MEQDLVTKPCVSRIARHRLHTLDALDDFDLELDLGFLAIAGRPAAHFCPSLSDLNLACAAPADLGGDSAAPTASQLRDV